MTRLQCGGSILEIFTDCLWIQTNQVLDAREMLKLDPSSSISCKNTITGPSIYLNIEKVKEFYSTLRIETSPMIYEFKEETHEDLLNYLADLLKLSDSNCLWLNATNFYNQKAAMKFCDELSMRGVKHTRVGNDHFKYE